jgi:hypothetical protein
MFLSSRRISALLFFILIRHDQFMHLFSSFPYTSPHNRFLRRSPRPRRRCQPCTSPVVVVQVPERKAPSCVYHVELVRCRRILPPQLYRPCSYDPALSWRQHSHTSVLDDLRPFTSVLRSLEGLSIYCGYQAVRKRSPRTCKVCRRSLYEHRSCSSDRSTWRVGGITGLPN